MKPNKIFKLTLSIFILTVISNQLNAQINFGTNTLSNNSSSTGDGNTGSGLYSFSAGNNNTTSGTKSIAIGYLNKSTNSYSIASGYGSEATGGWSMALGYYTKASGSFSQSFGKYVNASTSNSFVIGTGVSSSNYLVNNIGSSLMIGFNSNIPTLFVGISAGINTTGKVGIGTSTPTAPLQIQLPSDNVFNETSLLLGKSTREFRFMPNLSTWGMNPLSLNNDFGIFWNDLLGTNGKNGTAGLVIAPHADSPNGIRIGNDGHVGIGTNMTNDVGFMLSVAGKVRAEEIEVSLSSGWADYVFANDYQLQPLAEVEQFITENKHLPNVPSATEVASNGINLGEMDAILLRKIEELTLYMIELKKENAALKVMIQK